MALFIVLAVGVVMVMLEFAPAHLQRSSVHLRGRGTSPSGILRAAIGNLFIGIPQRFSACYRTGHGLSACGCIAHACADEKPNGRGMLSLRCFATNTIVILRADSYGHPCAAARQITYGAAAAQTDDFRLHI